MEGLTLHFLAEPVPVNVNVAKFCEYPREFGLEEAYGLTVIAFERERPVEKELDLRKEAVEGD